MQRSKLARWLVVGALAGFGLVFGSGFAAAEEEETTVQGSNTSSESTAVSGSSSGSNETTANAGPSASGDGGSSSQIGNNSVTVNQEAEAKSGDAVAGSQITGTVGGNATVQQTNNSTGATAVSGEATAANNADASAGPTSDGGPANQVGDNDVQVNQESVAETGSAVAGSQVTGSVGGESTVQNTNNCAGDPCATAVSGIADAFNDADVNAGPLSDSDDADALQVGDNDVVLSQASWATSGDAVAGGQVTGHVGGGATVQGTNTATEPVAVSGLALTTNLATATAGPTALGNATATQIGSNSIAADQQAGSTSGDAVSGSQVTGLASEEQGHLTVQNTNASEEPVAVSGIADSFNQAFVDAGPFADAPDGNADALQVGDNDVTTTQTADAQSGDAVAGSQVTGAVGGASGTVQQTNTSNPASAFSGDAFALNDVDAIAGPTALVDGDGNADALHIGDSSAASAQAASSQSGDAVAGSQVTGLVDSGDVTVQSTNTSDGPIAVSGFAGSQNLGFVDAGPFADVDGDGNADATQIGDNDAALSQDASAVSGDAVSGAAVIGVVDSNDVTIQSTNTSDGATSQSGEAFALNLGQTFAGPTALVDGDGTADALQIGDNDVALFQDASSVTGDAVAGSQVVGVVASGEVVAQLTNTSDGSIAVSGFADSFNDGLLAAGPLAEVNGAGTADATQIGDNALSFGQAAGAESGDAVSGSQVAGIAGASSSTTQGTNTSNGDVGVSGGTAAANFVTGELGPVADPGTALQVGDNDLDGDQDTFSDTGDSVVGSQVFGDVS